MKDYKINGSVINITLENDKVVKVATEWVNRSMKALNTDIEDVLLMWLEDNEYLDNEEQNELDQKAKENKSNKIVKAKSNEPKKKTQKERVRKENPTKEKIISEIAKILPEFATNVNVENAGKIITFSIGNDDFKLDLTQKRKKKAE